MELALAFVLGVAVGFGGKRYIQAAIDKVADAYDSIKRRF